MPDGCGRTEPERAAGRLQPPADVDVVTCDAETLVEAVDIEQRFAPERHVAAGDVLRLVIGEEHMRRPTRRSRDCSGDERRRRRQVRPADAGVLAREQCLDDEAKPVHVRASVVVEIRDDLSCCRRETHVTGSAKPVVGCPDELHAVARGDRRRLVRGAVVDDDRLDVGIVQLSYAVETVGEPARAVVCADNHRHSWGGFLPRRRRGERLPDGPECRLRPPAAIDDAELPIDDGVAAPMPLVRPGEDDCTGSTSSERRVYLPRDQVGLSDVTVGTGVDADLREDEGMVTGDCLEARDVSLERVGLLQEDVERDEVEKGELEILSRRIVGVCDEGAIVNLLHGRAEPTEKALDAAAAVPPHDRRRDLVAHDIRKHRGMACTGAGCVANILDDALCPTAVVEERHMLLPRNTHEHP